MSRLGRILTFLSFSLSAYALPAQLDVPLVPSTVEGQVLHPERERRTSAAEGLAQAILFYTPTCPYCHKVMTEDLPPLLEALGDQLEILAVDVSTPRGQAVYQAAIEHFQIAEERRGVPTIIIGDSILVGSVEIPQQFPGLVQEGLERGGVAWPALPGYDLLDEKFPRFTSEGVVGVERESVIERVGRDPVGNGLAIAVLVGMLASVYTVLARVRARRSRPYRLRKKAAAESLSPVRQWAIPLLCLGGLLISSYLMYIETSGAEAFCGPVGDCEAVQHSHYARLFGVIPVGLVGILGFGAILLTWLAGRLGRGMSEQTAANLLLVLTIGGTLFSIYLTFLEPFVIGATCSWCLASAILITALMWLAAPAPHVPAAQTSRP